jgi:hypothetical protein
MGLFSGLGFTGIGRGLMRMGPYGRSALLGAGAGAAYGAFSDKTSVLGGALKGAALGVGLRGGVAAGRAGSAMYRMARYGGMSSGGAVAAAVAGLGGGSASLIGRTYNRAINGFKALPFNGL